MHSKILHSKKIPIALTVLIATAGIWIFNPRPLFADEVITITRTGGFATDEIVVTLYSNRLVVISQASKLFISKSRLTKAVYAELLSKISSFSHDGHLESAYEALKMSGCDFYVFSLRFDGKTYYSSSGHGDEDLENIIILITENVKSFPY